MIWSESWLPIVLRMAGVSIGLIWRLWIRLRRLITGMIIFLWDSMSLLRIRWIRMGLLRRGSLGFGLLLIRGDCTSCELIQCYIMCNHWITAWVGMQKLKHCASLESSCRVQISGHVCRQRGFNHSRSVFEDLSKCYQYSNVAIDQSSKLSIVVKVHNGLSIPSKACGFIYCGTTILEKKLYHIINY